MKMKMIINKKQGRDEHDAVNNGKSGRRKHY